MLIAFDLDGVLVDTRQATEEAYKAVGVHMPPNAWGQPWHVWLNDPVLHAKKQSIYPKYLKAYARERPLYRMAQAMGAPVLTCASDKSIDAISTMYGPLDFYRVDSQHGKALLLAELGREGIFVDDSFEVRRIVADYTQWSVLSPEAYLEIYRSDPRRR